MKNFLYCRRTFLATIAIVALTGLGYTKGMDVSMSIAAIVASVAGANAWQGKAASSGPDVLTSK